MSNSAPPSHTTARVVALVDSQHLGYLIGVLTYITLVDARNVGKTTDVV